MRYIIEKLGHFMYGILGGLLGSVIFWILLILINKRS